MRKFYIVSSLFAFSIKSISALNVGQMCDPSPKYNLESWQYEDSCDDVYLFCDPNNKTCNYKGCSNVDYIKGWDLTLRPYPPRCNGTTYCPDNSSQCTQAVPIGSHCEIQRDDECSGQNSICLNSTCFIKAAPLSGNCGADITSYLSYDASGQSVQQTIIRDNCTSGTYCDLNSSYTCTVSKPNNSPCQQDRECLSNTCSADDICINGPDVFHQIKAWLWGVLGTSIIIFVVLILGVLWILHRYQSRKEHAKIVKFFGDNEEFAKYAMMANNNDSTSSFNDDYSRANMPLNDTRTSVVYLTTPDYLKSQALTTKNSSNTALSTSAQKNNSNNNSTSRFSSYSPTPRVQTPDPQS